MKSLLFISVILCSTIVWSKDIVIDQSQQFVKITAVDQMMVFELCESQDVSRCEPIGTYTQKQIEIARERIARDGTGFGAVLGYIVLPNLAIGAGGGAAVGFFAGGGVGAIPGAGVGTLVGVIVAGKKYYSKKKSNELISQGLSPQTITIFSGTTKDLLKILKKYL